MDNNLYSCTDSTVNLKNKMNVYKSSFLIIGKGVTYKHCKKFFNENSITHVSIDTHEVAEIKDMKIITTHEGQDSIKKKKIDLKNIDYIVVSPGITKEQDLILQETKIEFRDLIPKLKQITIERKNDRIFLRADGQNDYSTVMQIMGALNRAGFNNISLVTESGGPSLD